MGTDDPDIPTKTKTGFELDAPPAVLDRIFVLAQPRHSVRFSKDASISWSPFRLSNAKRNSTGTHLNLAIRNERLQRIF